MWILEDMKQGYLPTWSIKTAWQVCERNFYTSCVRFILNHSFLYTT